MAIEISKKILIVEDDVTLREFYRELLKGQGYEVDEAIDGPQGLSKVKKGGYDLILLDIILPLIDGYQILKLIKDIQPPPQNGPIIVLSNLGTEDNIDTAIALGVKEYWVKSQLTPGQVLEKIRVILAKS